MRLKITFDAIDKALPFNYRKGIHAYIYSALNEDESNTLHNLDNEIKPFVFSNIIGKYEIVDNKILFKDKCVLYIGSSYINILEEIFDFLTTNKYLSLFGNYFPLVSVEGIENNSIDGVINYRTISPVTVYDTNIDKTTHFYNPSSIEFKNKIKENIRHKYKIVYGKELDEYINVYNLTNIKHKVCEFKGFTYEAYEFSFKFDTKSYIHDLVMDTGIGYRNAIGFGMIEKTKR